MRKRHMFIAMLWLGLVGLGLSQLHGYMNTPGQSAAAPQTFPEDTAITFETGQPHLLVFIHRQCPCSKATLNQLLASTDDTVHTTVIMAGSDTEDSRNARELESLAKRLTENIIEDTDGLLADRFGAMTSGHVLMYDDQGTLAYSGGVTPGRGMVGPAGGVLVVEGIAQGKPAEHHRLPVFGCPLSAQSSQATSSNTPVTSSNLESCCP